MSRSRAAIRQTPTVTSHEIRERGTPLLWPEPVQIESLSPQDAPARLAELSPDVRAAVLIDAAGALVAASDKDRDRAEKLASLVRELVSELDAAEDRPPQQVEAQVEGGSVFLSRDPHYVLAAVTRRAALASLMLYDQRELLAAVEGQR